MKKIIIIKKENCWTKTVVYGKISISVTSKLEFGGWWKICKELMSKIFPNSMETLKTQIQVLQRKRIFNRIPKYSNIIDAKLHHGKP